jgi:16S rRNA (guanine1207-N2)-methyltransferase
VGPPPDHYFSPSPGSAPRPSSIRVETHGKVLELVTDRGTFSPGRLDPGTRLLLRAAPPPPAEGRFLDLGCGYGPLALTLALCSPAAEVVAVDVNERSLTLTAQNAARHGLDNVTVAPPEDVAPGPFDLIWSNPPIRVGKAALHDLLEGWLTRLRPTGSAVLVVNRHLGADSLQRWLGSRGFPTDRLASKQGYRLLRSTPG